MSAGAAWQPTDFQPEDQKKSPGPQLVKPSAKPGEWQPTEFEEEKPQASAPPAARPGFGNRFSEVTTGTQHPVDQAVSEWQNLKAHPLDTLTDAAETAAMAPVHLAYNAVHHPIDTVTGITGGPQFAEDLENKNYGGMAGDLAGGITNAFMLKKGAEALPRVAEAAGSGLNSIGAPSDYPDRIGTAVRQPPTSPEDPGKLKPAVAGVGRGAASAIGAGIGGSGGAIAGGLIGRGLTDALLPGRPYVPPPVPLDEFGFPAGENPPAPRGRFATLPTRMPSIGAQGAGSSLVGAAPEESGVNVVPEPRQPFPGETPNYMASVPREELPGLAQSRKPGAATQLQQLGQTVIYQPSGYDAPRNVRETVNFGSGAPDPHVDDKIGAAPQSNQIGARASKITESGERLSGNAPWNAQQRDYLIQQAESVMRNPNSTAEERTVAGDQLRHYASSGYYRP